MNLKAERQFTAIVTVFLLITVVFAIIVINSLTKDDKSASVVVGQSDLGAVAGTTGSTTGTTTTGTTTTGTTTTGTGAAAPLATGAVDPGAAAGTGVAAGTGAGASTGTGTATGPGGGTATGAGAAATNSSGGATGKGGGKSSAGATAAVVESKVPVPAAENSQGVTPTEIKLGGTSITNSVLAWPTATTLPAAYFGKVNADGGINGRKIKWVTYDADITDTNRVLANIRRLNEQDKVLALTGGGHPFADGSYPYLAQHGMPVIGTMSEIAQMYKNPFAFATGSYVAQGCRGSAEWVARNLKPAKVAMFQTNVYISQDCAKGMVAAFKSHGIPTVYTSQTPIGQPDFTQDVVRAKQAGAEWLGIAYDCGSGTRIAQAAQRQGWRPKFGFGGTTFAYCQNLPKTLGDFAEGSTWDFSGHLWTSSNPGAVEMVKLAKALDPNIEFEGAGLPAWTGANLMVDALKAVGTDVTRTRIMGWIAAQRAWTPAGNFTLPLDFTHAGSGPWTRVPVTSTMVGRVQGGDIKEQGFQKDPLGGDPTPDATYKP